MILQGSGIHSRRTHLVGDGGSQAREAAPPRLQAPAFQALTRAEAARARVRSGGRPAPSPPAAPGGSLPTRSGPGATSPLPPASQERAEQVWMREWRAAAAQIRKPPSRPPDAVRSQPGQTQRLCGRSPLSPPLLSR